VKTQYVLDPLWITKGNYLDAEYFTYVLLGASIKYRNEIKEGNIDRFYEVMFHSLNLNNLACTGKLFTSKLKSIFNEPRLNLIRDELAKIYQQPIEVAEIFRNANFLFLNLLIEYTDLHVDILEKVRVFYMNKKIHSEKEVFVVTNHSGSTTYRIWKLAFDSRRDFGYSFSKIKTLEVPELRENVMKEEIERLNDPKLNSMIGKTNVIFAIIEDNQDERKVAKAVKDTVLLNRGIAKNVDFELSITQDLHDLLAVEKIMPFTLNDWVQ
jgi:hypothetical protein